VTLGYRPPDDGLSRTGSLGQLPAELLDRIRGFDPIERWADLTREGVDEPIFQRDVEFLEWILPYMELLSSYFDAEVRGFELLPENGPMLLVGNHSGGTLTPDTSALFSAWYRERGLDSALYGLAFDAMFGVPGIRTLMRKIGQLPASTANAAAALERGGTVLVYPGGEHEVFRPWTDRNRIDFDGRKGFIRLALRTQVPVVPVVGHGGHESTIVLARGTSLAKLFRMDRLRVTTFPILFQVPWGVSPPGWIAVPLPAKIVVQLHEPLDWSGYGPEAADDPDVVDQCYDEITGLMQDTLSDMARQRPCAVASRMASLIERRVESIADTFIRLNPRGSRNSCQHPTEHDSV